MSESNVIQFIPREVYEAEMHQTLSALSESTKNLRIPASGELSRKRVVQAFLDAFECIGGLPRLAVWANENPSEFYKLYARLLPSQASQALGEENVMRVIHVLPRGPLDGDP
jgi:hypothetical protein